MQYRYTFRRVTISDLVISPALIPLFSAPERVGQFSMTYIQDRRDDPVNSRRALSMCVSARCADSHMKQPIAAFSAPIWLPAFVALRV